MNNQQQNSNNSLDELRHSAAHLLAAAVLELHPDAKPTIGPAIENGFYYDFEFAEPFKEEDLPAIEDKMRELVRDWKSFERKEVSPHEAQQQFQQNQYKSELIDELADNKEIITLYQSGQFVDLCRGGHVEEPFKQLRHFKLLSVAGAYWRGNEKNAMLTRIYGTAFFSKEELKEHLHKLEEAKARDHKKLGKDLNLFTFTETVGKGLPLWKPKGATIRRELERFIVDEELKRGYVHVYTPDIARLELYKKSGHYPYYKESMYSPIQIEDEEFMLRPMTCPHHFELYSDDPHSYKELPIRIAELAKLYRFEQSGELSGLQRVRSFCLADAHIVCRKSQAESEIHGVIDLFEYIATVFGLKAGEHYRYRLSLGDRTDDKKYFKDDASWDFAEDVLRRVLQDRKSHFFEAEQEAAFYGPKIDIQMKNVNGKEDTAFTIQYDFVMPKRFNLEYTNEQGEKEQPVVVHRSSIGAVERTMAFLIEHFAGAFPVWLSPIQVAIVPISEHHHEYAQKIATELRDVNIRVEMYDEAESMQKRIRNAAKEKIPYILVVGEKEQEEGMVAVRQRGNQDLGSMKSNEFVKRILQEVAEKVA